MRLSMRKITIWVYLALFFSLFVASAVQSSDYPDYAIIVIRGYCDPLCEELYETLELAHIGQATVFDVVKISNQINNQCAYLIEIDPTWCPL